MKKSGNDYDYLVVGAGLAGATFARVMTDHGKRCLVIDKNWYIGGNCYDKEIEGINVHMHGPHIMHTSSEKLWNFVNRFGKINNYRHQVVANVNGILVPLPINLLTFSTLFGHKTPQEAQDYINNAKIPTPGDSVESWCLSNIGKELYELLIAGYTRKQWERPPAELPSSYIRRLPMRFTANTSYFNDTYEGIPENGYTALITNMLKGIPTELGIDFFSAREELEGLAEKTVYTGMIDQLFYYDLGKLHYRSVRTEFEELETNNALGVAQMNFPGSEPYTRKIEYKHFVKSQLSLPYTIVGTEYSEEYIGSNIPSYPIHTVEDTQRAAQYKARAEYAGYLLCGRLSNFVYYDMLPAIGQAMTVAERELDNAKFCANL